MFYFILHFLAPNFLHIFRYLDFTLTFIIIIISDIDYVHSYCDMTPENRNSSLLVNSSVNTFLREK
jgi:hypothetical protein